MWDNFQLKQRLNFTNDLWLHLKFSNERNMNFVSKPCRNILCKLWFGIKWSLVYSVFAAYKLCIDANNKINK